MEDVGKVRVTGLGGRRSWGLAKLDGSEVDVFGRGTEWDRF